MQKLGWYALVVVAFGVAACGKQKEGDQTASTAPANESPQATSAESAAPAEPSYEDLERARKQAKLDYSTMEGQYLADPKGQWAVTAAASTFFGQSNGNVYDSNKPENVVGTVDGKQWTNDQQDIGLDWLEVTFAAPVNATELRVVFGDDDGVEAVSKVELQDTEGAWHTLWSGLSDVKGDERGPRTWFVRTFEKTSFKAKAAKVTIANNVQNGYKVIDAVQLVGE